MYPTEFNLFVNEKLTLLCRLIACARYSSILPTFVCYVSIWKATFFVRGEIHIFCHMLFCKRVQYFLVVSIGLFSFCFMPILYSGVNYNRPSNYLSHRVPPHTHFPQIKRSKYNFLLSNTKFLHISHSHLQTVFSSFICHRKR